LTETQDAALEAAIDGVGREKVFGGARTAGWYGDSTPPKWVWWEIVRDLEREGRAALSETEGG
jgi:hypothetical protein